MVSGRSFSFWGPACFQGRTVSFREGINFGWLLPWHRECCSFKIMPKGIPQFMPFPMHDVFSCIVIRKHSEVFWNQSMFLKRQYPEWLLPGTTRLAWFWGIYLLEATHIHTNMLRHFPLHPFWSFLGWKIRPKPTLGPKWMKSST